MRLYKTRPVSEWILKLGSIPLQTQGKEVVIQFQTPNIDNNKTFYTDSNGLEMQERILDYRPTWNFSSILNVTQNYYPINSALVIRDV
jgi:lysosomal alpha-mannosidase